MIDSSVNPARSKEANTGLEGDRVRLRFLYPNGALEVMDCTWVTTTSLGAPENPNGGWVVVSVDDRVMWKPLSHLIQLEVLGTDDGVRPERRPNGRGFDLYHR